MDPGKKIDLLDKNFPFSIMDPPDNAVTEFIWSNINFSFYPVQLDPIWTVVLVNFHSLERRLSDR